MARSNEPKYELTLLMAVGVGLVWLGVFTVLPEPYSWGVLLAAHLALPWFAFAWSRKSSPWIGFAFGPGALLSVYSFLLLKWAFDLWGGVPEGTWLAWMLWGVCAAALAAFAFYSLLVTSIMRRRYHKRRAP